MPSSCILWVVSFQGECFGFNLGENDFARMTIAANRFIAETKDQARPVVFDGMRNFVKDDGPIALPERLILLGIYPQQHQTALQVVQGADRVFSTKDWGDIF